MDSNASETEKSKDEIQVVVFTLGNEDFAFDISDIKEIIRVPDITTVPNSPDFVEGVINLRGQIKTVLNLKKRLGSNEIEIKEDGRIMIVENDGQSFGVIVDSVIGVFKIEREQISDPSSLLGKERSDFIRGIGRIDDRLVILLGPEKLFPLEEMAQS